MKKIVLSTIVLSMLMSISVNAVEVSQEQKIMGLYVSIFKRGADENGLTFWKTKSNEALEREENTNDILKELSKGFVGQEVFTSTYSGLNNRTFVEAIYRNTLCKAGDSAGITFWTELLDKGMSRSDFLATFIDSALSNDLTPENFPMLTDEELDIAQKRQDFLTNRVSVATYFTNELGTLTNVSDMDNLEDDLAYIASKKIIQGVSEEESTRLKAEDYIDTVTDNEDAMSEIDNEFKWVEDITLTASESVVCTRFTPFSVNQTDNPLVTFTTDADSKNVTIAVNDESAGLVTIVNCTAKGEGICQP